MIRTIVVMILFCVLILQVSFAADRHGSAETFLCRDGGYWASARRADGNVVLFLFRTGDIYCGGETRDSLTTSCGRYEVWDDDGRFYLKLAKKTGEVIKMPLEIKNDYTIILNGVELRRRSDNGKQSEQRRKEKDLDERTKAIIEYEKKAIADRNRRRLREELDALEERCQKKRDELYRRWGGDTVRDLETLRKDCKKEAKQIREMYGDR